MQTVFTGGATRLWLFAGAPDSSVHNDGGIYADAGELFMNTTTRMLYFCFMGGQNQQWTQLCYFSQAKALFSSILQSNWNQNATNAQDYIKNKPILANVATSGSYLDLSNKPFIPSSQIQSDWTENLTTAVDYIKNKPLIPPAQIASDWAQSNVSALDFIKNKPSIPSSQIQSNWTQSNAASADYIANKPLIPASQLQSDWNQNSTSALDYIKNKPTVQPVQIQSDWNQTNNVSLDYIKNKPLSRTQSAVTRPINSIFQISLTRDADVFYCIDISTILNITIGQSGTIFLEISQSSTFASNIQVISKATFSNTGTLVIGLVLNQTKTVNLSGYIPFGYYVRIRTVNNISTPTFTYQTGQEVLL